MERLARELVRLVFERTIRRVESDQLNQTASSFTFNGESYRRNRRTTNNLDKRFGSISFERWFYQNTQAKSSGIAPLDVRLGLVEAIAQLIEWVEQARQSDGKRGVLLQVGRDGVFDAFAEGLVVGGVAAAVSQDASKAGSGLAIDQIKSGSGGTLRTSSGYSVGTQTPRCSR